MRLGVAYYPEHWSKERWPIDARLMCEAGINLVRMAEFAWVTMEPVEGRYDFTWLDEAIAVLAGEGIQVLLGTPTEAMPPWLAKNYPEALAVDKSGHRLPYGARRDNCPTSATYRRLARQIATAMAQHYRDNPAVIGWQIDNEFGPPRCYCTDCEQAWREHLREQFGTVAELNRRWGTIFWSHCYGDWSEISLPRRDGGNPGLELEHRRFHSRQVVSFQREQAEVFRALTPSKAVTHNMCGFFLDDVNYYELARDLDVAGLDYYYNNSPWPNRFNVAAYEAAAMDLTRSFKKKNFWVLETPTGTIGSATMLRNLRPLEMRRMNFQALGHGAEAMLWFRWRTCLFGLEQYTHGVLGHDGVPGRRYEDLRRVISEFQALAPALEGTTVRSEVAIVYTFDNRWAMSIQPSAPKFDYFNHLLQYHRALKREGVNVDFVHDGESLDAYRVMILPAGFVMTPAFADKLKAFVHRGGALLGTVRTAIKDADNVVYPLTLPGLLRDVFGIRVEEYEALLEETPVRFTTGEVAGAQHLADWIVPEQAAPLAHFDAPHLRSFAAVTRHGRAYYVGTCFVNEAPVRQLLRQVLDEAGVARPLHPPEGVGISIREKDGNRYAFLLNHNDEPVEIDLSRLPSCRELIRQEVAAPRYRLAGSDVAVLHWRKNEK